MPFGLVENRVWTCSQLQKLGLNYTSVSACCHTQWDCSGKVNYIERHQVHVAAKQSACFSFGVANYSRKCTKKHSIKAAVHGIGQFHWACIIRLQSAGDLVLIITPLIHRSVKNLVWGQDYRIARNFRWRKFREIWGHGIRWRGKSEQSAKVFSANIICESFRYRVFVITAWKCGLYKVTQLTPVSDAISIYSTDHWL